MGTRYIGKIYEGRWKVIKSERKQTSLYILENIYNHEIMEIARTTLVKIENGETTISNVRSARAYRTTGQTVQYGGVPKCMKRQWNRIKERKEQ